MSLRKAGIESDRLRGGPQRLGICLLVGYRGKFMQKKIRVRKLGKRRCVLGIVRNHLQQVTLRLPQ